MVSTATRTADVANGRNNLGVRERRNLSQKVMAMKAIPDTIPDGAGHVESENHHDDGAPREEPYCFADRAIEAPKPSNDNHRH